MWAKKCTTCGHRFLWQGSIANEPPCPKCFPPAKPKQQHDFASNINFELSTARVASSPQELSEDGEGVDDFLEQCESILELISKLPIRAEDFGESVAEKVESIRNSVDKFGRVTPAQQTALDNMEAGVRRWFE